MAKLTDLDRDALLLRYIALRERMRVLQADNQRLSGELRELRSRPQQISLSDLFAEPPGEPADPEWLTPPRSLSGARTTEVSVGE